MADSAMSRNPYSCTGGNPVNRTDRSGKCIWDGCIAEIALIGAGSAFIGDWVHQVSANQSKGLDFWHAAYKDNLNGSELAISAGVGAAAGVGVAVSAGFVGGALTSGSTWLAAHPVVEAGLLGGELEWGRQYVGNMFSYDANGPRLGTFTRTRGIIDAASPGLFDWWKVAKSAAFSAATAGIWAKVGIFKNGIPDVLQITQQTSSAAFYGGFINVGAGIATKAIYNAAFQHKKNLDIIGGMSFADAFSNQFWGSLVAGASVEYDNLVKPEWDALENAPINWPNQWERTYLLFEKAGTFGTFGASGALGQIAVNHLEGTQSVCTSSVGATGGWMSNLTSFIPSGASYAFANFVATTAVGISGQACSEN
ncbi:MAG: hypothetical protein ABI947_18570 [Chloroflexota bacterium]